MSSWPKSGRHSRAGQPCSARSCKAQQQQWCRSTGRWGHKAMRRKLPAKLEIVTGHSGRGPAIISSYGVHRISIEPLAPRDQKSREERTNESLIDAARYELAIEGQQTDVEIMNAVSAVQADKPEAQRLAAMN